MIEYFEPFGEEDWIKDSRDTLKKIVANERSVNNQGKIKRTYDDGFDMIYFMMTDKMGHTTFFRMDEMDFYKEWKDIDNNKDYIVKHKEKEHTICGKCDRCKTCEWCICKDVCK